MMDPRIETALKTMLRQFADILFGHLEREHGLRLKPEQQDVAREFATACVPLPPILTSAMVFIGDESDEEVDREQ